MNCEKCNGNGEVGCYKCHGGTVMLLDTKTTDVCENCHGTGYVNCYHCCGNGRID